MASRSADATIKGYYYQFDKSILELMSLPSDTDTVRIEGIEDIDINLPSAAELVQCKYLSKSKWTNSAVREPISLMLDHFISSLPNQTIKYTLYVHFTDETSGNSPEIDVDKLKGILTYSTGKGAEKVIHRIYDEKGITDDKLSDFLTKFKLVFGKEFDAQQSSTINALKVHFGCSEYTADYFYYNNAIRVVLDIAKEPEAGKRVISKRAFISKIDNGKLLFNEWYITNKGKTDYLKASAKNIKSLRVMNATKTKYIFIGKEILESSNSELSFFEMVRNFIDKHFKMGVALRDAKPLTFILDTTGDEMKSIKAELVKGDIPFNDGYEEISFSSTFFNKAPIINTTKNAVKITKSSYFVKLLSKETHEENSYDISIPDVEIHFSKQDVIPLYGVQFYIFNHCDNFKDINNILNV